MKVRADSQDRLVRAAVKLVSSMAVKGVAKLLKPDDLEAVAKADRGLGGVSRQTAYRLWPNRNQAVLAVARYVTGPETSGLREDIVSALEVYRQADPAAIDGYDELKRLFREILSRNFIRQFESPAVPVGWVLQGAALTSSPLWRGERPDEELVQVGQEILRARSEQRRHIAMSWGGLLSEAMAAYGRRPRDGCDEDEIVRLMHDLFDGCLLRLFVDPELNDPRTSELRRAKLLKAAADRAADAMFKLGWSYTEPGALDDPRRPPRDSRNAFGDLVASAVSLYGPGQQEIVHPADAARALGHTEAIAMRYFAGPGDLADTVLRRLVAVSPHFSNYGTAMIKPLLSRLQRVAASYPHLFTVAASYPPTSPEGAEQFLDELAEGIAAALQDPGVDCPEPHRTASELVHLARQGDREWVEAMALLDGLGSASR